MKKKFWVFFMLFAFLFLISAHASAAECPSSGDPAATGLVPCGVSCQCTISNFFVMLARIYNFLVFWVATPLAVLAIMIGAVIFMTSAGNPSQAAKGKQILIWAIIGLALVFCSWLIIKTILDALGYTGPWSVLPS